VRVRVRVRVRVPLLVLIAGLRAVACGGVATAALAESR